MSNKLQRMLFNVSTLSPIAFFFSIVWWIQCGCKEVCTDDGKIQITAKAIVISIFGIIGLLSVFISIIIVRTGCRKLETVPISVSSVKSNDKLSTAAIVTYILPFSNLILKDFNVWLTLSIVGIVLLLIILSNTVLPNPILMLRGYHFYKVTTVNGSDGLSMISKRKSIQDAKTINRVITL